MLHSNHLPELVHLDDSALSVMIDFTLTPPHSITPDATMDHAINEMEINGVNLLLVINAEGHFQGIISSEDLWGEKPIQLMQARRVHRNQVLVKMIMVPYTQITALEFSLVEAACVGHIVKTLATHKKHYALAISKNDDGDVQMIRGIFTATQISKQLHRDAVDLFQ
jgi:CBS-domain-containing membrane protein